MKNIDQADWEEDMSEHNLLLLSEEELSTWQLLENQDPLLNSEEKNESLEDYLKPPSHGLGRALADIRHHKGWSLEQAAFQAGVSTAGWTAWEARTVTPRTDDLRRALKKLEWVFSSETDDGPVTSKAALHLWIAHNNDEFFDRDEVDHNGDVIVSESTPEALAAFRASDFKIFGTDDPDEIRAKVNGWRSL